MRRKKTIDLLGDINPDMNSLLDIIFILLIFVMLSMQLGKFKLMDLDFPTSERKGSGKEESDSIKIYLLNGGLVKVSGQGSGSSFNKNQNFNSSSQPNYSIDSWESAIQDHWKDKKIILATERKVPFEDFVQILERLQELQPVSLELGLKEK